MSFLTPFFLWLIPLVSIPLIIHLWNRRNIITVDFSTLRFLKLLEKMITILILQLQKEEKKKLNYFTEEK